LGIRGVVWNVRGDYREKAMGLRRKFNIVLATAEKRDFLAFLVR
jgi:hypothetical protein